MRIRNDTICKVCQGVFCCGECRHKHEIKTHAIAVRKTLLVPKDDNTESANNSKSSSDTTYITCPICEKRPLILESELCNEILLHIELHHLPLRCQKCFKTYNTVNDLKEFSKCIFQNQESLECNQSCYTDESSKATVTKAEKPHCMISQNSPLNEDHVTPISLINMHWKAKSKLTQEEFISDSVSSIKNISSISNSSIRRSTDKSSAVKGKVIRCSSTPVQLEMVFAKPKEQTFNATGGQMSSIQYNSGCESDVSPAYTQQNSQALEPVNRYKKVAGVRPRMAAVTPLRQVMSKSIQKAFAEHGLPVSNSARSSHAFQRKNIFDSSSSPEVNDEQSSIHFALDLRLSPAVRRSQSENGEPLMSQISRNQKKDSNELHNLRREILLSAQKLTTESIVITHTEHLSSVSTSTSTVSSNYTTNSINARSTNASYQSAVANNTGSSLFKSCSSVKIITATTEEIQHLQSFERENVISSVMPPPTPITRIPGSFIQKKIIKFETPKIELSDTRECENSPNDVFFTPNATPMSDNGEIDSPKTKQRKVLVKQNLNGRFSPSRRPSIKECTRGTSFSRIENINDFNNSNDIDVEDDAVVSTHEPEVLSQQLNDDIKQSRKTRGLWSLMTSVMRLPSLKGKKLKEPHSPVDSSSNNIIKRCASIAGSLVRSKSLVDENELSSLKRKRTYTMDNTSTYLTQFGDLEVTSSTSDFNTSSKRFRIQGRRPIDRMRLNS